MHVLNDPAYTVPPPPPAGPVGTLSWLRATVSRFAAGPDHARRRAMIVARLATIDPAALRERGRELGDATVTLAEVLGASDPQAAADAVAVIAPHYNPVPPELAPVAGGGEAARGGAVPAGGDDAARADAAVARLLALLPAAPPEAAAQQIAILVQSHAATSALIDAGGALDPPPVPLTRRIAPTGELVEVDLTGRPFGAGPRACPGAEHALALAAGVLQRRRFNSR